MTVPKSIKICGITIPIKIVPDHEMNGIAGEFRTSPTMIRISESISKELQVSTLIHEIVEAINWQFDLELSHSVITILGTVLYQVLTENEIDFKSENLPKIKEA